MKIRVLIADDEPLARERVRVFLQEEPGMEIVRECAEGVDTVRAVEELHPDLLFLDVQMPRLNGFEVLEAIEARPLPAIVFTTAHDQHAIRAFEVNAVDYLLKPYKQDRFKTAVERARLQIQTRSEPGGTPRLESLLAHWQGGAAIPPRILVKSSDRILFLRPKEIDYVLADGNYVRLHVGNERHMVRETMNGMESRLADSGFMRISRSAIVNLLRVRELKPLAAGEYCVLLQNGVRLDMTCPLRELQERLSRIQ